MGFLSKKPRICPICSTEVNGSHNDVVGHVMIHLEDDVRGNPNSGLRLDCGCPEALWPVGSDFPNAAVSHLENVHGMRR
jgi:hypothetical protein